MTPSPLSNGETADARMTAEREETKYLVPPARWETLAAELSHRLSGHRFTGEGANRLPDPHHYVTTIYFDTPSRALFRAAATAPDDNLKVRAKEYYDLHPSLAEVATDPTQIVRYQPWLWFELERREGPRTSKRAFACRSATWRSSSPKAGSRPRRSTSPRRARARACATSSGSAAGSASRWRRSASSTTAGIPGSRTKATCA